jgi:hypothetical protein
MRDPARPTAPVPTTGAAPTDDAGPESGHDWESVALGRVARRVDALAPPDDASPTGKLRAFGWESVALANLRRRLKARGEG